MVREIGAIVQQNPVGRASARARHLRRFAYSLGSRFDGACPNSPASASTTDRRLAHPQCRRSRRLDRGAPGIPNSQARACAAQSLALKLRRRRQLRNSFQFKQAREIQRALRVVGTGSVELLSRSLLAERTENLCALLLQTYSEEHNRDWTSANTCYPTAVLRKIPDCGITERCRFFEATCQTLACHLSCWTTRRARR